MMRITKIMSLIITTMITRARLYLAQSETGDSGNYTCVCDHNLKQTVRLVVTLGTYIHHKDDDDDNVHDDYHDKNIDD